MRYYRSDVDKNVSINKNVSVSGISIANATNGVATVFGYSLGSTTANANSGTITPAALNINAASTTKVYDATTSSAGVVTTSGLLGLDTVSGATQAYVSKNVLSANASTLNVTGYTVNDGNATPGNNYTVTLNTASGTITPASLSITANNASRSFGTANPPFSASYAGLAGADTPLALTGTISFSTPATIVSPIGAYVIIPSGQTSTNYAISYFNGALTVVPPSGAAGTVTLPVPAQSSALQTLGVKSYAELWSDCVGGSKASGGGGIAGGAQMGCGGGGAGASVTIELPRGL